MDGQERTRDITQTSIRRRDSKTNPQPFESNPIESRGKLSASNVEINMHTKLIGTTQKRCTLCPCNIRVHAHVLCVQTVLHSWGRKLSSQVLSNLFGEGLKDDMDASFQVSIYKFDN